MTTEELAWAAGLFEGEGSVRVAPWTPRNRGALCCDIANTNIEIVAFFRERWGGQLTEYDARERRRAYWRWRVYSLAAQALLNDILPYLRTRIYRERALLGLDYQAQKSKKPDNRTPEYHARQVDYYERMRVLNRRGVQSV